MVPYLDLPVPHIAGLPLYPFTYLVATGLLLSYALGQRRVRRVGLYAPISAVGLLWAGVGGFAGAHVLEVLAYQPHRLAEGPLVFLEVWEGLSSFGGFIGGTLAFYLVCRRYGVWMLPYLDALMYGFAPGWILARAGCYASHDHPGTRSDFFLAVAYPGGARHDLGFYEMLLAAGITLLLYLLPDKKRFPGFHTALVMAVYAPVRFFLDTLRTGDQRYAGLTAAQYLCIAMLGLAAYLVVKGRSGEKGSGKPKPPPVVPGTPPSSQ